jgi:hypothetical protein
MTTIIGIFDNARDLDKAVERLARAGFEDTVYDEAIVAEEGGKGTQLVFAPGYAPAASWGSAAPSFGRKQDQHAVVRAFKAHLADYDLPDDVIAGYASTFHHNEFLLVRTEAERADHVVSILRECGATRANRHG